jgi:transposase
MSDIQPLTAAEQIIAARYGRPASEVIRERVAAGVSQGAIAAEFGIDRATACRWMRRYGIQARPPGRPKGKGNA